ncbi:MAG: dihydrodipicolinate synthase family protein [Myxococcota bacterium]
MNKTDARPYRAAVCTVTPYDDAGRLDEAAVVDLVERIASRGLGLAIGTASPGEGFALSLDETATFYELVVRTAAGRVPVCAMGVEPRNANQLRPIVRVAEKAGVDVMQLYTADPGHSMKLTDRELERYFATLLGEMTIPAAISTHVYNGLVPIPVLARLLDAFPNIVRIHCTSEVNYLHQLVEITAGRCEILVGGPMQALSTLAIGGHGFLCSEGNIAPVVCSELQSAIRAGDLEAAKTAYRQLNGVFSLNVWPGGTVRFLKTAMRLLGLPGSATRPPFEPLDEAATAIALRAMRALDLPEWRGLLPEG